MTDEMPELLTLLLTNWLIDSLTSCLSDWLDDWLTYWETICKYACCSIIYIVSHLFQEDCHFEMNSSRMESNDICKKAVAQVNKKTKDGVRKGQSVNHSLCTGNEAGVLKEHFNTFYCVSWPWTTLFLMFWHFFILWIFFHFLRKTLGNKLEWLKIWLEWSLEWLRWPHLWSKWLLNECVTDRPTDRWTDIVGYTVDRV